MIDTIRLGIPLTQRQFERIQKSAFASAKPQWAILYPETGELVLRRITGLASTDQSSFHREIKWDVPYRYRKDDTHLTVELSLPKLYYGQNIRLLYNFMAALELLKSMLEKQFEFKGKGRLIDILRWQVWRLDVCYAWKCPSQQVAQQVLDSMKHLSFPRKRPTIYPTAILFAGATYSLKFYLKLPEFKHHDRKVLLKANASLEWINHCEMMADGVLRAEATLRRKYLKRRGIETVADILRPETVYEFHNLEQYPEGFDFSLAVLAISVYMDGQENGTWEDAEWEASDGQHFNAPEGFELEVHTLEGEINYRHVGEGFILRKRDQPTAILQYLLTKFLGESPAMQHADEVEAKLNATFKPVKAARLMGVWLYVQKFGRQKAKEAYGHDSFYGSYRDMKKAGVSLVEPPKNVVVLHDEFWKKFQVKVPSEFAVNNVDDYRDGGNVLNLPVIQQEAQ